MKRQHPDNPDLFWCTKCKSYKLKSEFSKSKRPIGLRSWCKQCSRSSGAKYKTSHDGVSNNFGIEWVCSRCGVKFKPSQKILSQSLVRESEFTYCSRECLNNRRLHPINDRLFFCFNCKEYKPKESYFKNSGNKYGITSFCKPCHKEKQDKYFNDNPEKYRSKKRELQKRRMDEMGKALRTKIQREQYHNNRESRVKSSVDYIRQRRIDDPEWAKTKRSEYKSRIVDGLRDTYIKDNLRLCGIVPTPETIELKRQQIKMKRTLNQFKQWRKENEPSNSDVQGKQHADETYHERSISA